jgi:uncharacterized protein (TIGR00251 family)
MIIKVKVKPNSREQSIKLEEGIYKIGLREKAEEGRANIELMKLLAKHFKVPSFQVSIKSGFTSKDKIVEISKE